MANRKESSLETLLGPDSLIKGEFISRGVVRLDGTIEGSVHADYLILGKTGTVRGEMSAREVIIDGTMEGNIRADEVVEIKPDGIVEGDISTAKLIVSDGAFFSGSCHMQRARTEITSKDEMIDAATEGVKKIERIFR